MQAAEVGVADRQVAVRPQPGPVDQAVARTVHRLHRVLPVIDLGEEHVLPVVVPVARAAPQVDVEDLRRAYLVEAVAPVEFLHVADEQVVDRRAARMEERAAGSARAQAEEVEFGAQAAVVAGPAQLQVGEVAVEGFPGREGGSVDPLQLFPALVSPMERARTLDQLDRADLVHPLRVRAAAEVDELAVPEQGDRLALRDVVQALQLQLLAHAGEQLPRLLAADLDPFDLVLLGEDLPHLRLDRSEVVRHEGAREAEVVLVLLRVIAPADVDLGPRPQPLYRVREHVLRGVAQEDPGLLVLRGEQPEPARRLDRRAQVDEPAVQLGADRRLRQARSDRARHVQRGGPGRHAAHRSVGQRQVEHRWFQGGGAAGSSGGVGFVRTRPGPRGPTPRW